MKILRARICTSVLRRRAKKKTLVPGKPLKNQGNDWSKETLKDIYSLISMHGCSCMDIHASPKLSTVWLARNCLPTSQPEILYRPAGWKLSTDWPAGNSSPAGWKLSADQRFSTGQKLSTETETMFGPRSMLSR